MSRVSRRTAESGPGAYGDARGEAPRHATWVRCLERPERAGRVVRRNRGQRPHSPIHHHLGATRSGPRSVRRSALPQGANAVAAVYGIPEVTVGRGGGEAGRLADTACDFVTTARGRAGLPATQRLRPQQRKKAVRGLTSRGVHAAGPSPGKGPLWIPLSEFRSATAAPRSERGSDRGFAPWRRPHRS
jgi:hypothetical protein